MSKIPQGITRADVIGAIRDLDGGIQHAFGPSVYYDLIEEGKRYPPKAVLGLAARRILGHALGPYDFKGGESAESFRVLRSLGFLIKKKLAIGSTDEDWTEDEDRLLVEDYFAMLSKEVAGEPYSKTAHREALMQRIPGRSKGSIEFKHQNVSAVLVDLGFTRIEGYKPAKNYERELLPDIVMEHLVSQEQETERITALMDQVPETRLGRSNFATARVEAPPLEHRPADQTTTSVPKPRKYDQAERDAANRNLGRAGEEYVLEYEKWRLEQAGLTELARQVEWSSHSRGDGLGYDIESFDPTDSQHIYIEVKTTNGVRSSPFYVSKNEVRVSKRLGSRYRLYRVFAFSKGAQFYEVAGDLEAVLDLIPSLYIARRS